MDVYGIDPNEVGTDAVITYVNCEDTLWRQDYIDAFGEDIDTSYERGITRYRDLGTLELCIKSIRMFAKWIDNIYLVVSRESQVPEFIKDYGVSVIYHRDFIPQEYLPIFNSSSIDLFLPLLPGLKERFVFFNDDMILTSKTCRGTFFTKESWPRIGVQLRDLTERRNKEFVAGKNAYNIVLEVDQDKREVFPQHCPSPFRLSWIKECYERYNPQILSAVSKLGRSPKSCNQYVYIFYQMIHKRIYNYEIAGKSFYSNYNLFDIKNLPKYRWICLNDSDLIDRGVVEGAVKQVKEYLDNLSPLLL